MVEEMSFWDWNAFGAVGAWLGGLGAASAAITAIWITKREDYRRIKIAKSLFQADLQKLNAIYTSLGLIINEYRSNAYSKSDKQKIINAQWKIFSSFVNRLEFFGHSEHQFHFVPLGSDFTTLQEVVVSLQMQNTWGQVHEEIVNGALADINVEQLRNKLGAVLDKFK